MTVEERLESVERELAQQKRRCRRVVTGLIVANVAGVLAWAIIGKTPIAFGQTAAEKKVIRANEFILEDENGKTRAQLSTDKDGTRLILTDANGKDRVGLHASNDDAWLVLSDANDKGYATLFTHKNEPRLKLLDENGKTVFSAP
jgi:hypothetical protein